MPGSSRRHPKEPSPASGPPGVSPCFWALLTAEPLGSWDVLDVGTGSGRLALALAPLCRRVVAIDRDPGLIEEARSRAEALGLGNVEFVVADADQVDYVSVRPGVRPHMVVAHLFLSTPLVEKASTALHPGGVLAFVGFHVDQWQETARRSRFAYDEDQVQTLLAERDFAVEHLEVERHVQTFDSVEAALAAVVALEERWRQDCRWFRYIEYLEQGGRTLTQSHLVVKARRR